MTYIELLEALAKQAEERPAILYKPVIINLDWDDTHSLPVAKLSSVSNDGSYVTVNFSQD